MKLTFTLFTGLIPSNSDYYGEVRYFAIMLQHRASDESERKTDKESIDDRINT